MIDITHIVIIKVKLNLNPVTRPVTHYYLLVSGTRVMAELISLIALLQDGQDQLVFLFLSKLGTCPGPKIIAKIFNKSHNQH